MLTSLELFAGCGGLALGFERGGFSTIGLVERDKDACATLRINRPSWRVIEKDVLDFVGMDLCTYYGVCSGDLDVLTGGVPCQPFSYAGLRLGFGDIRGTLFNSFVHHLKFLLPKSFLFENVRGLLSQDGGRSYRTIFQAFTEAGYIVQSKLLDANDYGVAQHRERLILVGLRQDLMGSVGYGFPNPINCGKVLGDVLNDVPESAGFSYSERKRGLFDLIPEGCNWRSLPSELSKVYMEGMRGGGGCTGVLRRLSRFEPSLTILTSPNQNYTGRCHPLETRPLNIRESARVQSFPDTWQFCGSLSSQYRQIGNAVPVELAYHLSLSLRDSLLKLGGN